MINRLNELRVLAETTSAKVNREEEKLVRNRNHLDNARCFIEQISKWVENGENYLIQIEAETGVLNLTEAKQVHDKHKVRTKENKTEIIVTLSLKMIETWFHTSISYLSWEDKQ